MQAKPNKTKAKKLGFIRQNWGFSMRYGESKQFFSYARRTLRYAPEVWLGSPPSS
jgi:hypothetical protein